PGESAVTFLLILAIPARQREPELKSDFGIRRWPADSAHLASGWHVELRGSQKCAHRRRTRGDRLRRDDNRVRQFESRETLALARRRRLQRRCDCKPREQSPSDKRVFEAHLLVLQKMA